MFIRGERIYNYPGEVIWLVPVHNPPPQFSSQGIRCPAPVYVRCVLCVLCVGVVWLGFWVSFSS